MFCAWCLECREAIICLPLPASPKFRDGGTRTNDQGQRCFVIFERGWWGKGKAQGETSTLPASSSRQQHSILQEAAGCRLQKSAPCLCCSAGSKPVRGAVRSFRPRHDFLAHGHIVRKDFRRRALMCSPLCSRLCCLSKLAILIFASLLTRPEMLLLKWWVILTCIKICILFPVALRDRLNEPFGRLWDARDSDNVCWAALLLLFDLDYFCSVTFLDVDCRLLPCLPFLYFWVWFG